MGFFVIVGGGVDGDVGCLFVIFGVGGDAYGVADVFVCYCCWWCLWRGGCLFSWVMEQLMVLLDGGVYRAVLLLFVCFYLW